jgi:hypothetical protein
MEHLKKMTFLSINRKGKFLEKGGGAIKGGQIF